MTDTKISALGAAGALGGGEAIPTVQGGTTVRTTPAQLLTYVLGHAATAEAIQDAIGANAGSTGFLRAGPGLSMTYDDAANTLTFASASPPSMVAATNPTANDDSGHGFAVGSGWLNTASGVRWICLDASPGAAIWSQLGANDHPGYVSGRYYSPQRATTTTSIAQAADVLYAVPIYIAQRVTLSALAIRVNTGAASSAVMLALYANDPATAAPGNLIAQGTGSASTATNGTDAVCSFASNVTVAPGMYWLAAIFNGAPACIAIPTNDQFMPALVGSTTLSQIATTTNAGVSGGVQAVPGPSYATVSANGFPSSFGASASRNNTSTNATPMPCIKIA